MNHLLWLLSYRCSQREGHLHLPTLLPFAVPQVTWFSYRRITSIVEIFWSSRSQPFCRLHAGVWFYLPQSPLRLLSVCNSDTGNASRASSWTWLYCGLQAEVIGSGDQWPRETDGLCWPSFRELRLWRVSSYWCGWRICKWKTRKRFALCFFNICFITDMFLFLVIDYLLENLRFKVLSVALSETQNPNSFDWQM